MPLFFSLCELGGFARDNMWAWKGFDWDTMNRLHEKGYISDPKSKAKSVAVSEEGARLAEELFKKYFAM
ncbi:MAG: DUF6429 family protein [Nitrospirota bacterium]